MSALTSTLDVSVQCRNLPDKDRFDGQSDAFCVLSSVPTDVPFKLKRPKRKGAEPLFVIPKLPNAGFGEREVGRTEVIRDSADPDFTTSFELDYRFESEQRFVLRVFDEDKRGDRNLSRHDYLGGTTFKLSELMGSRGNTLARPLGNGKGHVILKAEEASKSRDVLRFQLSAKGLKNKDGVFGKSDPFLVISRKNPDNVTWNQVWKSEVVKDNLSPTFKMEQVPLRVVCNGDVDRPIQIKVMDWDGDGSHDDMGCVETTVRKLLDGRSFDVLYTRRKHGRTKTSVEGSLIVRHAEVIQLPTFEDYISGGCEISLMVAVDFTASNGDPRSPQSLHYRDPTGRPNEYQSALWSIGSILQDYDTNRRFPLWGFGAKVDGAVSHCFQVGPNAEVCGAGGLLDAYNNAFQYGGLELYGPTKFGPVIEAATAHALSNAGRNDQSYGVLLILTDGAIHDMLETIDLIWRAASDAPMSIIIVGVGSDNFAGMEALDGDGGTLRNSSGSPVARDIVQFVPFARFARDSSRLAAETLAEIPRQVVDYFMSRGIRPRPMPSAPSFSDVEIAYTPEEYEDDQEITFSPFTYY